MYYIKQKVLMYVWLLTEYTQLWPLGFSESEKVYANVSIIYNFLTYLLRSVYNRRQFLLDITISMLSDWAKTLCTMYITYYLLFEQTMPLHVTKDVLCNMSNNYMVVEVWEKKTTEQRDQVTCYIYTWVGLLPSCN